MLPIVPLEPGMKLQSLLCSDDINKDPTVQVQCKHFHKTKVTLEPVRADSTDVPQVLSKILHL